MNNQKVSVVTGGGSGIGYSISKALADLGHKVVVVDLSYESAQKTANEIISNGGLAAAVELNVAKHREAIDVFNEIESKNGRIDVLINNAGIGSIGTLEETSEEELDRVYQVNVKGVYNCSYAAIPHMKRKKTGVICVFS